MKVVDMKDVPLKKGDTVAIIFGLGKNVYKATIKKITDKGLYVDNIHRKIADSYISKTITMIGERFIKQKDVSKQLLKINDE